MYTIKLTRRGNKLKVQHVNRTVKLVRQNNRIKFAHTGARGPQGEQGIQGIPGHGIPAGGLANQVLQKASDADYDYKWLNPTYSDLNFSLPFTTSDLIIVDHYLGKYPSVNVIDSAGDEVEGEVFYSSINSLIVRFSSPFSGTVICN